MRLALATALLALAACSPGTEGPVAPSPSPAASPGAVRPSPSPAPRAGATVTFGEERVRAEVADTPAERRRGLMGRETLAPDAGMLFLFDEPTSGSFWMKDTLIPLSIAFLRSDEGSGFRVVAILEMEPCEADPCPTYEPGTAYDAALEVNRGWFAEAGVEVGDEATVVLGRDV